MENAVLYFRAERNETFYFLFHVKMKSNYVLYFMNKNLEKKE